MRCPRPREYTTTRKSSASILRYLFRDRAFVGTSELDNIAPGQDFELNLGIDEGLKIDRELVERQVDKKLIGGQRRIILKWQLTLSPQTKQEVYYQFVIEYLPEERVVGLNV